MKHREVVVVVDAEGWLRRSLVPGLEDDGLEVARAATAIGALSACAAQDPLCVVVDLELSDHDGLWLAAALRDGNGPTSSVPIVLLAERPDATLCAQAIAAGVDVVLDRRGAIAELRTYVRALVAMSRRVRAEASRRAAKADARARSEAPERPASGRSGTQRKVTARSPGHAVREEVLPSARPDPRAEPTEDSPTRRHVWGK